MTRLWAVYGHFGDLGGHFVRLKPQNTVYDEVRASFHHPRKPR